MSTCTRARAHAHACTHAHVLTHTHTRTQVHTRTCGRAIADARASTRRHTPALNAIEAKALAVLHLDQAEYVHACVQVCMRVCMCTCIALLRCRTVPCGAVPYRALPCHAVPCCICMRVDVRVHARVCASVHAWESDCVANARSEVSDSRSRLEVQRVGGPDRCHRCPEVNFARGVSGVVHVAVHLTIARYICRCTCQYTCCHICPPHPKTHANEL